MVSHWKMGADEIHLRATGLFLLLCCIQEKKKTKKQMVVTDGGWMKHSKWYSKGLKCAWIGQAVGYSILSGTERRQPVHHNSPQHPPPRPCPAHSTCCTSTRGEKRKLKLQMGRWGTQKCARLSVMVGKTVGGAARGHQRVRPTYEQWNQWLGK